MEILSCINLYSTLLSNLFARHRCNIYYVLYLTEAPFGDDALSNNIIDAKDLLNNNRNLLIN